MKRIKNLDGSWEQSQSLQRARQWFAAVNCDNVIYAIGGQCVNYASTPTNTVERFNPDANKWQYAKEMNTERSGNAACVMQGKIYVVGGVNAKEEVVKTIECYDPSHDA